MLVPGPPSPKWAARFGPRRPPVRPDAHPALSWLAETLLSIESGLVSRIDASFLERHPLLNLVISNCVLASLMRSAIAPVAIPFR